jgi:hypothetical protein
MYCEPRDKNWRVQLGVTYSPEPTELRLTGLFPKRSTPHAADYWTFRAKTPWNNYHFQLELNTNVVVRQFNKWLLPQSGRFIPWMSYFPPLATFRTHPSNDNTAVHCSSRCMFHVPAILASNEKSNVTPQTPVPIAASPSCGASTVPCLENEDQGPGTQARAMAPK